MQSDREYVWLNRDSLRTDVETFLAVRKDTEPQEALDIVKGRLLSGWDEPWVHPQWLRLEEAYAQTVVEHMKSLNLTGSHLRAMEVGQEALTITPSREDIHVELIRAYNQAGLPAQALAQFERLETMLDEEWGEKPSETALQALDVKPEPARLAHSMPKVPLPSGRIFGRSSEVMAITDLLRGESPPRVLSVLGAGGIGKTTVSLEVATQLKQAGVKVAFVPLAEVNEPDLALEAIAIALSGTSTDNPRAVISSFASSEASVLILDNAEHLIPELATVVRSLIEEFAKLSFLITSRRRLNLVGESIHRLGPLRVPTVNLHLAGILEADSVRLFADRARAVNESFQVTIANARAVASLCVLLGGVPLAIELAATKCDIQSPAQVLAAVSEDLSNLDSDEVDRSERHRSLEAVLNWSLSTLDEEIQSAFVALSIFRGGFDAQVASAVTEGAVTTKVLRGLAANSLIESVSGSEVTRFRLLEPVRQYCLARLEASGDREAVARKHFSEYERMFLLSGSADDQASSLEVDLPNLWEAIRNGMSQPDLAESTAELLIATVKFAQQKGHAPTWRDAAHEAKHRLSDSLAQRTRGRLTLNIARISRNCLSVSELQTLHSEAVSDLLAAGDSELLPLADEGLAAMEKAAGNYAAAEPLYERALEGFRRAGDINAVARCYRDWAMNAQSVCDNAKARERLEFALEAAKLGTDLEQLAWVLTDLGTELAIEGDTEASERRFQEAFEVCQMLSNPRLESIIHWQHGESELRTGRVEQSVRSHVICLQKALEGGYPEGAKWYLITMGCALAQLDELEVSVRCIGWASRAREAEGRSLTGDEHQLIVPALERCRIGVAQGEFSRLWSQIPVTEGARLMEELIGQFGSKTETSVSQVL